MGCAGSKPHHLLSSSSHHHHHHHTHTNSPQKGFILFNSKTIEYLKANEAEIKAKLVERCQHKLLKAATVSAAHKSLFGSSSGKKSGTLEPETKVSEACKLKETAIESAVDYVLKYAINDFDIENFKSSNHLSMKQIRKDIMKKNSSSSNRSVSKLQSATANTSMNTASGGTLKGGETTFYKLALNTTIDEFGLFIQENFVVINEFQAGQGAKPPPPVSDNSKVAAGEEETAAGVVKSAAAAEDAEAALKLKEALELARQNFYKGKMSMVCLTKTGGYVVKEVKDSEGQDQAVLQVTTGDARVILPVEEQPVTPVKPPAPVVSSSSPITPENLTSAKTVTILDPQTNQKSKVAISSKINIEDVDISATFKIIDNDNNPSPGEMHGAKKQVSRTSLRLGSKKVKAEETMAEFMKVKSGLSLILSDTIDSIVAYSTETPEGAAGLEENLKKAKEIVEFLNKLTEHEYKMIDERLVETTISLDYVNREFKNYLALFEAAAVPVKQENDGGDRVKRLAEIAGLVEQLDKLIGELPKELFASKGLPHPAEVNQESPEDEVVKSLDLSVSTPDQTSSSGKATTAKSPASSSSSGSKKRKGKKNRTTVTESGSKKSSPFKKIIDIKKEIAISILNVGEVLAKTIDYYSLSSSSSNGAAAGKDEDLKELIKISEQQAAKQALAKQQSQPATEAAGLVIAEERSKENAAEAQEAKVDTPDLPGAEKKTTTTTPEVNGGQAEEPVVSETSPGNTGVVSETSPLGTGMVSETSPGNTGVVSETSPRDTGLVSVDTGVLELKVLTTEVETAIDDPQQSEASGQQAQQQQQSTTASSLSSPTLSTTSSLSVSRTGSSSPVPPSSTSEQQQLLSSATGDECGGSDPSAVNRHHQVTAESTPVTITSDRVVSSSSSSDSETNVPSADLLIGDKAKMTSSNELDTLEVEKPKHASLDEPANGVLLRSEEISFLVNEMVKNDETTDEKLMVKSSQDESELSSSDILSSNDDHHSAKPLDESEHQVVFRNGGGGGDSSSSSVGVKRMSLDEELMYQLEEVDKKVKYMNETCSENEGDDDDDDYRLPGRRDEKEDEELELANAIDDDDERLFHPRTPAKIKSQVRSQQRNTEIQEEIKQISSVIQDLVQTINAKTTTTTTESHLDFYKTPSSKRSANSKRSSVSSTHSGSGGSGSSIPVRQQKMLTKQKATMLEDEMTTSTPGVASTHSDEGGEESFKSVISSPTDLNTSSSGSPHKATPTSKKNFKSKLPVKK